MKRVLYFLSVVLIGSIAFAQPPAPTTPAQTVNAPMQTEPDYTTEEKNHQVFFYDKYGKLLARNKTINGQTYFYDKVGQLVGKSVPRNNKTFYYNQIGKFIGVCDENGDCQDKDFVSTGKIPPLPAIKHFKPVYDDSIMNPVANPNAEDEEE